MCRIGNDNLALLGRNNLGSSIALFKLRTYIFKYIVAIHALYVWNRVIYSVIQYINRGTVLID